MREGWTYKKIGEIGTLLRGKGIQKTDFIENGQPCIHYGQIHTAFGVSTEKHLSTIPLDLYNKSIIASKGDVLLTLTSEDVEGSCKSTAWLGNYDIAVSSDAAVIKHSLNPKFFVYYTRSKRFFAEKSKYAKGFKVTHIKTSDIAEIPIPVPAKEEQQVVVSELDKINELISLKKAQMSDLDSLAQSIFYDMFGDPIENEKGWEVKKLGEIFETSSGGTPSKSHSEYYEGGNIPWLRSGEVSQGFIYETELFITDSGLNNSSAKLFPSDTVVVAMYGATVGQVGVIKKEMTTNQAICGIFPNEKFSPIFIFYFLMGMKPVFLRSAAGGAQPNISQGIIKDTLVPLPPLPLQQEFAKRIELIEQQKAQISSTIKDLETLLASRMQYWFD